ncbi:MAG: hypothetical protein ACJ768_09470, partial [Gaiellaceae bacterium]
MALAMPASPGTTSAARRVRDITDDKLAELVETAPSRRLMDRPRPRADFIEGLSRTYDVLRELGSTRGDRFLTSWDELCALVPGVRSDVGWLSPLQRYTEMLEEIGLIQVRPVWAGDSWALVIRLRCDGRPCSSTG